MSAEGGWSRKDQTKGRKGIILLLTLTVVLIMVSGDQAKGEGVLSTEGI